MQSIKTVHYHGLKDAFVTIQKREGARRLLRGMSAMVVGAGPAHAMYFACYEKMKHTLTLKMNGKKLKNSSIANGEDHVSVCFLLLSMQIINLCSLNSQKDYVILIRKRAELGGFQ